MSGLKIVLKNTAYLITSEQLSRIFSLIQVIILVRYLGKTDYGVWSLTQSLPGIFLVFTDWGINSIMLRRIAAKRDSQGEYLSQVLLLKLAFSFLYVAAIYGFVKLSHYDPEVTFLISWCAVAYAIFSFTEVLVAVYRALEKFIFEAIVNTAKNISFLGSVCIVVWFNLGLHGIVYSLFIIDVFICMFSLLWYLKHFPFKFKMYSLTHYITLIKESLPFGALAIVNPIFFQIDIIMLSQLSTFQSTGIYSAAYRIVLFLYVVPTMMRRTLFPRFSVLNVAAPEDFRQTFADIFRLTTLFALPASIGLFLLSDKIVILLFSTEYAESITPLKILSLSICFYYLRSIFEVALYGGNLEMRAVIIFAVGTLLNVILDYLLIKRFDFVGAAFAALFAEIAIFLGYYWCVRGHLFRHPYIKPGLKMVLSALVMGLFVKLCESFSLFIQVLVGTISYTLCLIMFRVLNENEQRALWRFTRHLKQTLMCSK